MPNLDYNKLNELLIDSIKHVEDDSNCILTFENVRVNLKDGKYDRFHLKYPYAKIFIKLFVCYNFNYPTLPPTVYFAEHNDFIVDLNDIKILHDWNSNDPKCLNLFLKDLVNVQFLNYNENKLKKFSKKHIYDEYIELKQFYYASQINVYINSNYDYASIVLCIKIDESIVKDLKSKSCKSTNNNDDDISLTIMFIHYKDKYKFSIDYEFSQSLQSHLDTINKNDNGIKFKEHEDCTISMLKCVQNMTDYVIDSIKNVKEYFEKRKAYMNEFVNAFKSSIIEYDTKLYENAWILISHNDFQCILNVKLRSKFPDVAPLLTLHSVYHVNQNRLPYKQVIQDYPFNSKWQINEMIQKLKEDLPQFIDSFKESSKKEGKLNI